MKKLIAPGVTLIVSPPAKQRSNSRPFDHVTNVFFYANIFTDGFHAYIGITFTLKDGSTPLYAYAPKTPSGDPAILPIIDRLNIDGVYFNRVIRPNLLLKL